MGYTGGIIWTDDLIEKGINKIADTFSPRRMPTNREVIEAEGNHKLSNAIQKHGGYEYWANKLGLEQKYSDTQLGISGERFISEQLIKMGFDVETTSMKYPYDLLINGCIKVDVKTANTSYVQGCPLHSYRLAKGMQTCDFYIFYEADTSQIYVVPANKLNGQVQVGMGDNSQPYAKYLGAFHLIKEASELYQRM